MVVSAIVAILLSMSIAAQTSNVDAGKPASDLLVKACKNASIHSDKVYEITEKFCISTLRSNNRTVEAKDLRDLALVGVDVLKGRLVTASGKIKEMLRSVKKGTSTARRLNFCEVDCNVTVSVLDVCTALLRDYRGDNSSNNDGPPPFELPDCVEKAHGLVGYCGDQLSGIPPGRDADARLKEFILLSRLAALNTALLAPYKSVL